MLNQNPDSRIAWLKDAWFYPEISPVWDFEWIYLTVMELVGPGRACSARIEWESDADGGASACEAYCHRTIGHKGDHVALKIPQGGSQMSKWQIYKRWK